ncbi:MAG: GNAT family N-acetyltransferase [Anaerolineae bacterium]|nr:GNAT family N-acetyltransferase [Anaerolineae bacterium]
MCDPDVRRYLPGGQPLTREQAERSVHHFIAYWHTNQMGSFAIIQQADDIMIGQCGLEIVPGMDGEVEVHYALAKAYWGQGFAPEAARACLRYGFEVLNLPQIVALFMPENKASEKVMLKLGMTYQGVRAAYDTELPCYVLARDDFDPGDAPYTLTP